MTRDRRSKGAGIEICASIFKARCLELMDEVRDTRVPVVITKRGTAIAKLVPVDERRPPLFGCLRGSVMIVADIVAPIDIVSEANAPPRARS